jgi:hypothetical protein
VRARASNLSLFPPIDVSNRKGQPPLLFTRATVIDVTILSHVY